MSSGRRALATTAVMILAVGSACSGDDDSAADEAPTAEVEADVDADVEVEVETDDSLPPEPSLTAPPVTEPESEPEPEPEPEPESDPEREPSPPRLSGLPPLVLSTPHRGGGDRPLLEWSPVDHADHYGVYLYAPDESIYWTWQGYETSVFVGGATQLSDSMPGPSVAEGMTWSVVAYDADLLPVAVSDVRPISP